MVGRGAQGAPWRLAEIAHGLGAGPRPAIPEGEALSGMVSGHYEAILSFYGSDLGLRVARKHLGWYLEEAGADNATRRAVLTADAPAEVLRFLRTAFDLPRSRAA